jgi:hypothetical protein
MQVLINSSGEKISRFECIITLKDGTKDRVFMNLPSFFKDGGKDNYKDKNGNSFDYDLISYRKIVNKPDIKFGLFDKDVREFKKSFIRAVWAIYQKIRKEIKNKDEIKSSFHYRKLQETKELYKNLIKEMHVSHRLYYNEFEQIYLNNTQEMKDITEKELKFIKNKGHRSITRRSAFYILLYRHRNNEDFLLKDEYDINNEESLKELFEKFYNAFKQNKIYISRKRNEPSLL